MSRWRGTGTGRRTIIGLLRRDSSNMDDAKDKTLSDWHRYDPTPWSHPFLTVEHLTEFRAFATTAYAELEERLKDNQSASRNARGKGYAFVGNMCNSLYIRMQVLLAHGMDVELIQHPHDRSPLNDPHWEEYGGVATEHELNINAADSWHPTAPINGTVHYPGELPTFPSPHALRRAGFSREHIRRWHAYFALEPLLSQLRRYRSVFSMQVPHVAYLANVPYIAGHSGADLRISANRGDALGTLTRLAYRDSATIAAASPWTLSGARLHGWQHVLPLQPLLSPEVYSPGSDSLREEWLGEHGGDFIVLSTSRLDRREKGSLTALEGFARFAQQREGARLAVSQWGIDASLAQEVLGAAGVADRLIPLPLSGKRRLILYLKSADCMLDQFAMETMGSTAREALMCGLPVIMNLNLQRSAAWYGAEPPVLLADSPGEVAAALEQLYGDSRYRQQIAWESRNWAVSQFASSDRVREYELVMESAARGLSPDFSSSPMCTPKSREEAEYENDGLHGAPTHP